MDQEKRNSKHGERERERERERGATLKRSSFWNILSNEPLFYKRKARDERPDSSFARGFTPQRAKRRPLMMYGPMNRRGVKKVYQATQPPRRPRKRVKTWEISKKHIITWFWTMRARIKGTNRWFMRPMSKQRTIRCIRYTRCTCLCMIDSDPWNPSSTHRENFFHAFSFLFIYI